VNVLDWLAHTPYAVWVDESWGWPIALTIHAFGNGTVIGLMAIIGLRLFGLFRSISYTALLKLIPLIWIAIGFQVISGVTLWMTKPAQYLADGMFEIKFTFVVVASVMMWFFHKTMKREAAAWDAAGAVSPRGRKMVAASCLLWAGVLIGGRLTAYLGSLYAG
jgi:hypothetical protein